MLVTCPNCNISFNPKLGLCPKCGLYEVPADAAVDELRADATNAMEDGVSKYELEKRLSDMGVSQDNIREVLDSAGRSANERARDVGVGLLGVGLLFLIVAFILGLAHNAISLSVVGILLIVVGAFNIIRGWIPR